MTSSLGNPAPLGLLAFGMTTAMLMFVDMGWTSTEFQQVVAGYAIFLGGLMQFIVAIAELCKGSSFSFAVFGCYSAFWLGWALVYLQTTNVTSTFGEQQQEEDYTTGRTLWLFQWAILTACFWIITFRKNLCLIVVFGLLTLTFVLLAAATASGNTSVQMAGGYVGFCTAIGAWYTAVAELVNEEWAKHVLPGLRPTYVPERFQITSRGIQDEHTSYDAKSNTLFLQFRYLQIKSHNDVMAIKEGVESTILTAKGIPSDHRVHVVVDYQGVVIADSISQEYWNMVSTLESTYYLSARRFHVTSFGTPPSSSSFGSLVRPSPIQSVVHNGTVGANTTTTTTTTSKQEAACPSKPPIDGDTTTSTTTAKRMNSLEC